VGGEALSASRVPSLAHRFLLHLVDCGYWFVGLWVPSILRFRLYGTCVKWYYDHTANSYDRRASFGDYNRGLDAALAALCREGQSPARVLDAACGTGVSTLKLAAAFPRAKIVGLDLSPAMLSVAAMKAEKTKLSNVEFVRGNVGRLPFGASEFDLVVLQNAPVSLSELARVTRKAGALIVAFSLGGGIPHWLTALFVCKMRRAASLSDCGCEVDSFWAVLHPRP
jgi:ubiquinone/menaquinone biosynthesis C-methylase UbiE